MKKIKLIIMLMVISFAIHAQGDKQRPNRERIESMKIGMITQRLNLTPEEAKVFWPVYNKYSAELQEIRKDRRENLMNARENFDSMSDAEIEKAVDNEI